MTIRELTSELLTDLRDQPSGIRLSRRFIYSKAMGYARTLINQETTTKLFKQLELFTPIKCVEMKTVPLSECCQVPRGIVGTAQKSICKLPDLYITTQKRPLLTVMNIDQSTSFEPITPKEFQSLLRIRYNGQASGYFWIDEDGHLVIPNRQVTVVRISGLFIDPSLVSRCNGCGNNEVIDCPSILDSQFVCPDYLQSIVKDKTLETIVKIHEQLANKELIANAS
jgi:hypothetical protein